MTARTAQQAAFFNAAIDRFNDAIQSLRANQQEKPFESGCVFPPSSFPLLDGLIVTEATEQASKRLSLKPPVVENVLEESGENTQVSLHITLEDCINTASIITLLEAARDRLPVIHSGMMNGWKRIHKGGEPCYQKIMTPDNEREGMIWNHLALLAARGFNDYLNIEAAAGFVRLTVSAEHMAKMLEVLGAPIEELGSGASFGHVVG